MQMKQSMQKHGKKNKAVKYFTTFGNPKKNHQMNQYSQIAHENSLLKIENEEPRKRLVQLNKKLHYYEKIMGSNLNSTFAVIPIPLAVQTEIVEEVAFNTQTPPNS